MLLVITAWLMQLVVGGGVGPAHGRGGGGGRGGGEGQGVGRGPLVNFTEAIQAMDCSSWTTTYCPAVHEADLDTIPALLLSVRQEELPEHVMPALEETALADASTVVQTLFTEVRGWGGPHGNKVRGVDTHMAMM